MLDQLTSVQLSEWEAYDKLDPIGTWREDYRMAHICSLLANIHNASNTKEGETPLRTAPIDFMPVWDEAERDRIEIISKKQSVEEIKSGLLAVFKGWTVKDGKRVRTVKPKPKNKT